MKIAIIGASGQLGTDLCNALEDHAIRLGHSQIEITDQPNVAEALRGLRDAAGNFPDAVINTAAYNKVDIAEDEPHIAFQTNALGPRNLALECEKLGIPLCHISTDFIFGADAERSTPYTELDRPGPVSAYGIGKLAGEHFVRAHARKHFLIRTCGLYGHAGRTGNGNFVETMIRLGTERDSLSVVNDQFCTPTSTKDLAKAIVALVKTNRFGTYNITNEGQTSWYNLAAKIFEVANINVDLTPISSAQFGAKATRPPYSVLDNTKVAEVIGYQLSDWESAVTEYIASR